jgi:hypothetical protein
MWWLILTETFELAYLRHADPKRAYKMAKDDTDLLNKLEEVKYKFVCLYIYVYIQICVYISVSMYVPV